MSNTSRDSADPQGLSALVAAKSKNYLIRTLSVGQFCTVHLSLPRHALARNIASQGIGKTGQTTDTDRPFDRLRTVVQVTKTCNGTVTRGKHQHQLDHEIKALKQIGSPGHPNILGLLAEDESESIKTWFTMPLCSSSTLSDVLTYWSQPQHDINIAFAWHISIQIAQALMYLHGGVRSDGRTVTNWPAIAHNDLHAGNVFFLPGGQADYRDYPAVVLADFDRAITEDPSKSRADVVEYQRRDINNFGVLVELLGSRIDDQVFGRWAAAVAEIRAPKRGITRYDNALRDLEKLTKTGMKRREELYKPLTSAYAALFARPSVRDAELGKVVLDIDRI